MCSEPKKKKKAGNFSPENCTTPWFWFFFLPYRCFAGKKSSSLLVVTHWLSQIPSRPPTTETYHTHTHAHTLTHTHSHKESRPPSSLPPFLPSSLSPFLLIFTSYVYCTLLIYSCALGFLDTCVHMRTL